MLKLGDEVRLTSNDVNRLTMLTGSCPDNIKSSADLNRFIDRHIGQNMNGTPEGCLINLLLADAKIQD